MWKYYKFYVIDRSWESFENALNTAYEGKLF